MKKIIEIILIILILPFVLIGLVYMLMESIAEMIIVKNTTYFKRNKLKIKDEYYFGILTDPVFIIKNMICKYDLKYKVVTVDEEKSYLVVNENNECMLIFIRMKNLYFENDKLLFQENNDEGNEHDLEEYMKSIESDTYIYDRSKLIVLKEFANKNDYEKIMRRPNTILLKAVNKDILTLLR